MVTWREGATLVWTFNPIKPRYPYKLPARAEIVEFERNDRVTWEVRAPGFHALHSYRFAEVGPDSCRFGSWEVAEGPAYRALRRFWLRALPLRLPRVARGRRCARRRIVCAP